MSLEEVFQFVEAMEAVKRSASRLLDSYAVGAATSYNNSNYPAETPKKLAPTVANVATERIELHRNARLSAQFIATGMPKADVNTTLRVYAEVWTIQSAIHTRSLKTLTRKVLYLTHYGL
ncbi:hypothetical protein DPMN_089821 [Dreissena polymorpha]|uniref:Uncharacterized protein n=1 Tax=Dreissena polymorpha TaxID=45954 RepID=A0A9D4QYG1_DREPO|nr:hypothetical protein DPMN_089821 [Dreissena polymorpha]